MILPYIYESVTLANIVAEYLEEKMNKYERLSIVSIHEFVNELDWIQDTRYIDNKPKWMSESEPKQIDTKRGWYKEDFDIRVLRDRWNGGSGYMLALPEPVNFE